MKLKKYIHVSKDIVQYMKNERISKENKLKTLETSDYLVKNPGYAETRKNLIKSTKKKQTALELEVNVIGTSSEKNLRSSF